MAGIDGKVIAITGASSGIGRAAALLLAGRGATVVLGARRTDELQAVVRERSSSPTMSMSATSSSDPLSRAELPF